MRGYSLKILCIITLLMSVSFNMVHAQSLMSLPGSDPISVRIFPQNPKPGEIISVSLESFSIDLRRTTIFWAVNGVIQANGIGIQRLNVQAGDAGSATTIDILATTQDGYSVEKRVVLRPQDIDLIWQSRSYTPPFYKGKALYPNQGVVIVTAIPHMIEKGAEIDPKNLVYTWKLGKDILRNVSGYGKDSIEITGGVFPNPLEISVSVTSFDGKLTGVQNIVVNPSEPKIALYEESPLYGTLLNKELYGSYNLVVKEMTLRSVPYFYTTSAIHATNPLVFNWRINNTPANSNGQTITLRRPDGQSGRTQLSLEARNPEKFFQSFVKNLIITFDASQ